MGEKGKGEGREIETGRETETNQERDKLQKRETGRKTEGDAETWRYATGGETPTEVEMGEMGDGRPKESQGA